ncbi:MULTISPECIES: protein-disulfide reductase DsbD domain-containing protein [unclassified Roseibium]|uniref:protein-disulfide reductase DsbD domain-containing protein n=1 Tax=unclassified Roseibium TaxID=2629323 RepID=UPI0031705430
MKHLYVAFALLLALVPGRVHAAMTGWTEVHGGAVRLIASGPMQDGQYLTGLEFLLEPGWHTYWRYPGEAGIPPQITTEASSNVKELDVLYPVPERYSDGFSQSIVYHDGIVLPVRVVPEDPERPVSLHVEVFFGICKDICVPGDAALSLDLSPQAATDALAGRLIQRDLERVPSGAAPDDLRISSVSLDEAGDMLVIEARTGDASDPDLFAEAPAGSFIALPQPVSRSADKTVWTLSTKGLATNGADDNTLRLVLTAGGKAIEHLEPIQSGWVD